LTKSERDEDTLSEALNRKGTDNTKKKYKKTNNGPQNTMHYTN